jgi:hypothetical protein
MMKTLKNMKTKQPADPVEDLMPDPDDPVFLALLNSALNGLASQFEVYNLEDDYNHGEKFNRFTEDYSGELEERCEQLARRAEYLALCSWRRLQRLRQNAIDRLNAKVSHE